MPHDLALEEAVLGAIMLEKNAVNTAMLLIKREHFYNDFHAIIFDAIETLHKKKIAIDILTVTNEIKRVGKLDIIGGPFFIVSLTNRIASAANIEFHISIIVEKFIRRRTIEIADSAKESAFDGYKDPYEALDSFIKESKELYNHINFSADTPSDELISSIMQNVESNAIAGYPTKIKSLNGYITSLQPGLKYTIGGRTSMGKTSLLTTLACDLIIDEVPGVIFSMEMSSKQLMINIISYFCEIDSLKIRRNKLSYDERALIHKKMKEVDMNLLIIDKKSSITDGYLFKRVKKLIKDKGIRWFAVDYTQIGKLDESKGKQKEERIGDFSIAIKDVAKSEDVAAIELSQINRGSEKAESKRPGLADLKDSGAIEASADVVMLLYRPEYYGFKTFGPGGKYEAKGAAELIIAKQRMGPTGNILLNYQPEFSKFTDGYTTVQDDSESFEPMDDPDLLM